MDFIKEIFPEVTEDQLKEFKKALGNDYIPKEQYRKKVGSLEEELKTTQTALSETTEKFKGFESLTGDNEQLKKDLAAAKSELETFKADSDKRMLNTTKTYAVEKLLRQSKAHEQSVDLLINEFDLEKVILNDNGEITNGEDLLKPIKEKRSSLFATQQSDTNPPIDDGQGGDKEADLWAAVGLKGYQE